MDQKRSLNYPSQLAFLLALVGVFLILAGALVALCSLATGVPVASLDKPEHAAFARVMNSVAAFCSFFLPAFALAVYLGRRPFNRLGFNMTLSAKQVSLVLALSVAGMMLNGALGALNERIPLPNELYNQAKALEETYRRSMLVMARMNSFPEYIVTILTVAVAPAIFEEVLFRGGFQQIFVGWTKNKWIGILITSILFSAIHFSYFGFLPRLALGIVLGFVFHYSKNIWLSIFLHFLNNAIVITQLYMMSIQGKPIEKTMDESMPIWWGLIGLVVVIVIFRGYKKESERLIAACSPFE